MSTAAAEPLMFFEWIRVIRRLELGFNPSPTGDPKKRISSTVVQHVALVAATYGNPDGTNVHPGIERLARVLRMDETIVGRCLERLRDLGLMIRTFSGSRAGRAKRGRTGKADIHRLAIPGDLSTRVAMLDPDEDELIVPDGVEAPRAKTKQAKTGTPRNDLERAGSPGAAPDAAPAVPVDNPDLDGDHGGDQARDHPVLPHGSPGAAPDITRCSTAPPTHGPTQDLPHTSSSPYGAEVEGAEAGRREPSAEVHSPAARAAPGPPADAAWAAAAGRPLAAVGRHRRLDQAELDAAYAAAFGDLNRDLDAAGPLLELARAELGAQASNASVVIRAHKLSLRRSA